MQSVIDDAGLSESVEIDSAGTIGFHSGDPADSRMRQAASRRGYDLTSRARKVMQKDLIQFDLILVMDEENRQDVMSMALSKEDEEKIVRFCDFCNEHEATSVPDPYYGGSEGFERVLDLLEDGCQGILEEVQQRLNA